MFHWKKLCSMHDDDTKFLICLKQKHIGNDDSQLFLLCFIQWITCRIINIFIAVEYSLNHWLFSFSELWMSSRLQTNYHGSIICLIPRRKYEGKWRKSFLMTDNFVGETRIDPFIYPSIVINLLALLCKLWLYWKIKANPINYSNWFMRLFYRFFSYSVKHSRIRRNF